MVLLALLISLLRSGGTNMAGYLPMIDSTGSSSAPTRNESLNGTGVNRGGVISVLSGTQLDITAGFG